MAKKKVEGKFSDMISKILDEAGKIDFVKLTSLLSEIFTLFPKGGPGGVVKAGNGCCDHAKCSQTLVAANMESLKLALEYHCACCEECGDESADVQEDGE